MNDAAIQTVIIADAHYQIRTHHPQTLVQEAAQLVEQSRQQLLKQQASVSQHHAFVLTALQYALAYRELQEKLAMQQALDTQMHTALDELLATLEADETLK